MLNKALALIVIDYSAECGFYRLIVGGVKITQESCPYVTKVVWQTEHSPPVK